MLEISDALELAFAVAAVIIGGAGLLVGSIALSIVVGIKNSTHQIVWKTLEDPADSKIEDPFSADAGVEEGTSYQANPNKKFSKETSEADEDPIVDLDDPSVTSNNWN